MQIIFTFNWLISQDTASFKFLNNTGKHLIVYVPWETGKVLKLTLISEGR